MQPIQIISGFSDIKVQFADKRRIRKPLSELHLWFTDFDGMIYVHDYKQHGTSMVIALNTRVGWKVTLIKNSRGAELTIDLIKKYESEKSWDRISLIFNKFYAEFGFFPP